MGKKKINKKGMDDLIISPYLFLMMGIIALAIITASVVNLSSLSDVRSDEALALNNNLFYAVDNEGYLNEKILQGGFDIFKDSHLNSDLIENSNDYYFNVSIYDDNGSLKYSFIKGNPDFEIQCGLSGQKLAKCYSREIGLLNPLDSSQVFHVKIKSGVNIKI